MNKGIELTEQSANRGRRAINVSCRLMAAGRTLFADHPIDAVSIDTIVSHADVAKGSFYNHFADKDALLAAIVASIRDEVEATISHVNQDVEDPARRMARAQCIYFDYCVQHPEHGRVLVRNDRIGQDFTTDIHNQPVIEDIAAGLALGRFVVPTVEAGAMLAYGVAHVGSARICQDPVTASAIPIAQQLCQLLLKGLGLSQEESSLVAAQAVDEVLRRGIARNVPASQPDQARLAAGT